MLEQIFQLGPIPSNSMSGVYDPSLVILSYLVATFASYIALDITGRLRDIRNTPLSVTLWIVGGAFAMGAGIWSMHFIGMLAFKMNMPMSYDPKLTILSMMVAIAASGFALFLLKPRVINVFRMMLGGVILGLAISAMHYTGMAAMTNMTIHYLPGIFTLSIIIGILASEAALYLAIKSTQVIPKMRFRLKFVSAFVMGAAICGMHYTGIAAAIFTYNKNVVAKPDMLDPQLMAISIAGVSFFILGVAFIVSTYKESLNQQLIMTARQAGMAEVASSVLHNVGNVLNSVNVSSTIISEKISNSRLSGLSDLKLLLDEHKNNFDKFIREDARGKHFAEFVISLAQYWEKEKIILENETQLLMNNIEHIRKIISTQQDISRVNELKRIESIKDILEEAILISGIEDKKYGFTVKKEYVHLGPILIDKAKLLQILVNLIQNARDSLSETPATNNKELKFILNKYNSSYVIKVIDNGVGIPREKLTRIFEYGYTTKKEGHGFGLHSSAITVQEMGGDLKAESDGINKGATFTVILPYRVN